MVQKGINWLHITNDTQEKIFYYHKWIGQEAQVAFTFLYAVDVQLREENNLQRLRTASTNLENLMGFSTAKWPTNTGLRVLYEQSLSEIAVKILKVSGLPEEEVLFWVGKIYSAEGMSAFTLILQSTIYGIEKENKADLHYLLGRLIAVHAQIAKPTFNAPENLTSQVGDSVTDLLLRSFRLNEKLSDAEFASALRTLQKRHFIGLAFAWGQLRIDLHQDFSLYFIQKAFVFIKELQNLGLNAEANSLSEIITQKASTIFAKHYDLEGMWQAQDSKKRIWNLNIIYSNDDFIFANFSQQNGLSFPLFHVVYDVKMGGFIASLRGSDADIAANVPVRFYPQDDGSMKIVNMISPDADLEMTATRIQRYPHLLAPLDAKSEVNLNGVYEGKMTLPGGPERKIRLVVTVVNQNIIANLQHPSFAATLNYGNDGRGGVMYLTRGNDRAVGSWMHIRARLESDGYLRGYMIIGNFGLMPMKIEWKKVQSLNENL